MHSNVANATKTPSHTARNQSARSAFSNTALRKANRELADVLGGKSMILVCISNPSKNCFHRQYTVLRRKVAKKRREGRERRQRRELKGRGKGVRSQNLGGRSASRTAPGDSVWNALGPPWPLTLLAPGFWLLTAFL